ncbi:MAG: hypothetical protein H0V00_11855 [Chloroflexia bacterium]|nr:hypothetical protein [Chloroflexia bacterium]
MSEEDYAPSWRTIGAMAAAVFVITLIGCSAAFALWFRDLGPPQIAVLGTGNRLSLLVSDGPARLVIATGNDPIAYENALTRLRPIFARRIDLLLVAGDGDSLLVPLTARDDRHVRRIAALAPLPPSAETAEMGSIDTLTGARRIQLGPAVRVTVETAFPFAADPTTDFPSWRATIEHGGTRIVALSDGAAAALFPPSDATSVLIVAGDDPVAAWNLAPAVALIANAEAIGGPELRSAFAGARRPPQWGFRVHPNEALRLRFVPGGVEIASESAQDLSEAD